MCSRTNQKLFHASDRAVKGAIESQWEMFRYGSVEARPLLWVSKLIELVRDVDPAVRSVTDRQIMFFLQGFGFHADGSLRKLTVDEVDEYRAHLFSRIHISNRTDLRNLVFGNSTLGFLRDCYSSWRTNDRLLVRLLDQRYKVSCARILLSQHRFEVNTGRWTGNSDRTQRYCSHCLSLGIRVCGDEVHYLDHCPKFFQAREKFWGSYFRIVDFGYPDCDAPDRCSRDMSIAKLIGMRMGLLAQSPEAIAHVTASLGKFLHFVDSVSRDCYLAKFGTRTSDLQQDLDGAATTNSGSTPQVEIGRV